MCALGNHIVAELNGISPENLNDPGLLERVLVTAAQDAGTTIIESSFNPFAPHGVTGIIVIQESHLAIHTWPEHGYAALDVFTCGDDLDPEPLARSIASILQASSCETTRIKRGQDTIPAAPALARRGAAKRSVWFTDRQDDIALSLRHAGVLFAEKSAYQTVEVIQSYGYGKMLLLDDQIAFTERDEFVYHEMIAHIPALHHAAPANVLIIGGGDGGACREFLKHKSIETITVIEIDPTVTEASREHFPQMATCLDDKRVTIVHGDGRSYLEGIDRSFDIVVIDCLDTAGELPFDTTFYECTHGALAKGGLCVTQIASPTVSSERFTATITGLKNWFAVVAPYLAFLPTYNTGMLSFALAGEEPLRVPRAAEGLVTSQYINDGVITSAFSLPTFVTQLIED